jgi:8-oxo-dGTP diphosphatase
MNAPGLSSAGIHHYCLHCGAELVTRVIEGRHVEACPNDDFVLWRDPKVSTAVVVEVTGGVVLGRRAIEPGYGLWCLPGGFVNHDESPADAATRECAEEICARVRLTSLIGVYHVPKEHASSMVGIAYRASIIDGEEPRAGAEMLEVGVFPVDALPPLAFPSHRHVIDEFVRSRVWSAEVAPRSGAPKARREARPSREQAPPRRPRTR